MDNPFGQILADSWGVYEVRSHRPLLPLAGARALKGQGALVTALSHHTQRFEVPHHAADAYGALCAIQHAYRLADLECFPAEGKGLWRQWAVRYAWAAGTPTLPPEKTFTQLLLEQLRNAIPQIRNSEIALAVAAESLETISPEMPWGNSLALLPIPPEQMATLLNLSKTEWKLTLADKAARLVRLFKRRPQTRPTSASPLLVTSIGDLDRHPWAPAIDPRTLVMYPTPIYPHSANLLFYSKNGYQGVSLCGKPEHWALQQWPAILNTWKHILQREEARDARVL